MLSGLAMVVLRSAGNEIPVRVLPKVELLSIIFRLAEADEYRMADPSAPYVQRVDAHFGKYASHPAVQYARKVREELGIGFDAVAGFAVNLKNEGFGFKVKDDQLMENLGSRWKLAEAKEFAKQLEGFAKETRFADFVKSEGKFYKACENSLERELAKQPYKAWFDSVFGPRYDAPFAAVPGLLNGGANYGMTVNYPGQKMEILPILGTSFGKDGLPSYSEEDAGIVVHEFCHTYTNAYVDAIWPQMRASAEVLFPSRKQVLAMQAYGTPKVMIQESLVRAMTVRFAMEKRSTEEAKTALLREQRRGFYWTARLSKIMDEFNSNRSKFPVFRDFMPRVAEFFAQEARNLDSELAKLPKVVRTSVKEGDTVAPGGFLLQVEFDRAMVKGRRGLGGVTLAEWPDGTKGVRWADDGRSLETMIALDPGKDYTIQIGNMYIESYESQEGSPLDPVLLRFRTSASAN